MAFHNGHTSSKRSHPNPAKRAAEGCHSKACRARFTLKDIFSKHAKSLPIEEGTHQITSCRFGTFKKKTNGKLVGPRGSGHHLGVGLSIAMDLTDMMVRRPPMQWQGVAKGPRRRAKPVVLAGEVEGGFSETNTFFRMLAAAQARAEPPLM